MYFEIQPLGFQMISLFGIIAFSCLPSATRIGRFTTVFPGARDQVRNCKWLQTFRWTIFSMHFLLETIYWIKYLLGIQICNVLL